MARSEQLLQLAVQLASLASLEDAVTHGLQSLLESPSRLVASISVVEQAVPAPLVQPRSRSRSSCLGSILLSQRGPTDLSVKSCPAAPPDRSVSTHRRSGADLRHWPCRAFGARPVRPAPPPRPSLAPWLLIPVLPAGLSRSLLRRR